MINQLHSDVQKLETELAAYAAKPTKASPARIRKLTQQLNNIGPAIRKELVSADKKGYN
jgi:hypothetical protein